MLLFKMFGQHETYANIICNRFQKSTFRRIFGSQTLPTRLMAAGNSLTDEDFTPRPVASRPDWSTVAAGPTEYVGDIIKWEMGNWL